MRRNPRNPILPETIFIAVLATQTWRPVRLGKNALQ
jgi:hypothetical protein